MKRKRLPKGNKGNKRRGYNLGYALVALSFPVALSAGYFFVQQPPFIARQERPVVQSVDNFASYYLSAAGSSDAAVRQMFLDDLLAHPIFEGSGIERIFYYAEGRKGELEQLISNAALRNGFSVASARRGAVKAAEVSMPINVTLTFNRFDGNDVYVAHVNADAFALPYAWFIGNLQIRASAAKEARSGILLEGLTISPDHVKSGLFNEVLYGQLVYLRLNYRLIVSAFGLDPFSQVGYQQIIVAGLEPGSLNNRFLYDAAEDYFKAHSFLSVYTANNRLNRRESEAIARHFTAFGKYVKVDARVNGQVEYLVSVGDRLKVTVSK